jgi:hypothetical protein
LKPLLPTTLTEYDAVWPCATDCEAGFKSMRKSAAFEMVSMIVDECVCPPPEPVTLNE